MKHNTITGKAAEENPEVAALRPMRFVIPFPPHAATGVRRRDRRNAARDRRKSPDANAD